MSLENKGSIAAQVLVTAEPDRSGNFVCNGTSDETDINLAFGHLTSGRTWKETVKLIGDFTIDGPIMIPDYTNLDLSEAHVFLANGSDCNMIENEDLVNGNDFIEIYRGVLNGNKANNASGSGIYINGACTGIWIICMTIDSMEDAGIRFWDTDYKTECLIEDNHILEGNGNAIQLANTRFIRVVHNMLDHCMSHAIETWGSNYNTFVGNQIEDFHGLDAFELRGNESSFVGNRIHSANIGFDIMGSWNSFIGNTLDGMETHAFFIPSGEEGNTIMGNTVQGGHQDPGEHGFLIQGDYNDVIGNTSIDIEVTWGWDDYIHVTGNNNVIADNIVYTHVGDGVHIHGGDNNLIIGNRIEDMDGFGIHISDDADNNRVEGNYTNNNTSGCATVAAGTCDNNDFSGGNQFMEAGFVDAGTGTIFPTEPFQFVKEIVGDWLITSPTGIEVDLDTEGAICLGHLPRYVRQVMRLRVWAVALAAPIDVGGQMHAEFTFNAAAGNEAYNLAANSWVLANHDSEEADYVANNVIQWVIEDGDVGNELSNLLGGDKFELIVMHEAGEDPDGATDAVFGSMEVEYI